MSLDMCILGSGSSGNSTLLRAPGGVFLIDAGFGPRATQQRLHGTGISVENIAAVVLTHLDSDHFNGNWLQTLVKLGIRVHVARSRVKDFLRLPEVKDIREWLVKKGRLGDAFDRQVVPFDGALEPVPGVQMEALHLPHDEAGSHGFVIDCQGYRAGYATDLGHVPDTMIERFCGVDVLAIESNYDPYMEQNSPRPWYLKQRIMGGSGHLSNEQALAAVKRILDRTAELCGPDRLPRHIVLLHRSRECNCPKLVQRMFAEDARIGPILTLAHQHERTAWLHARRGRAQHVQQLALAWA